MYLVQPFVSIQLVSPASGDVRNRRASVMMSRCFHSIGIPSEWGWTRDTMMEITAEAFPFNWYPQRVGIRKLSANTPLEEEFPFNWYPQRVGIRVHSLRQ